MLKTAFIVGDQNYDSDNHHGPGENRALALRSGLRFGIQERIKIIITRCFVWEIDNKL